MPPPRRLLPLGEADPPDTPSPDASRKKRETIGQACENCRKLKTKCDGQKPSCSSCVKRNVICEYSTFRSVDLASMQAMEKRVKLSDAAKETLLDLFDQIRTRSEPDAIHILHRIRKGEDPESILKLIRDGDLLMQPWMASATGSIVSTRFPTWSFARREPNLYLWVLAPGNLGFSKQDSPPLISASGLSPAERWTLEGDKKAIQISAPTLFNTPGFDILLDERIDNMSAQSWTSVPCEDRRFADLIRLYFIVEHPVWAFVEENLFLNDLASGRRRFCSSLLVNAILCFASHNSHQVSLRHKPWHSENIGSHFYREARRLWELEESKASITATQAACVLAVVINADGRDKVGVSFIQHAIRMGKDLDFYKEPMTVEQQNASFNNDPELFRASAVTEWALLRLEKTCCFFVRIPPMALLEPSYPIPYTRDWKLKSGQSPPNLAAVNPSVDAYFDTLQTAKCELYLQVHKVTCIAFKDERIAKNPRPESREELMKYHERLMVWYHSLPSILSKDATLIPQNLFFHMECLTVFQNLIRFIINLAPGSAVPASENLKLLSTVNQVSQTLKELAQRYTSLYSLHQPSIVAFHCFTIVAFTCLEENGLEGNLPSRELFITCFNALHEIANTVFLTNSVLLPLEAAAQRKFGPRWVALRRSHAIRERKTRLSEIFERTYSAYPSDLSNPDFNAARTDFVLRSLAELSLREGESYGYC